MDVRADECASACADGWIECSKQDEVSSGSSSARQTLQNDAKRDMSGPRTSALTTRCDDDDAMRWFRRDWGVAMGRCGEKRDVGQDRTGWI